MRLKPLLALLLLASGLLAGAVPLSTAGLPAPHLLAPPSAAAGPSLAPSAPAPLAAAPAASAGPAVSPAAGGCTNPTPSGTAVNWNSPSFFADALVTFSVPGSPGLDGSNFQAAPCDNVIPTYTNGFWLNVTTNVALSGANVTIWGTTWPQPGQAATGISNFDPSSPRTMPMYLTPPYFHTASFFFNVYRFFWPGSQVYFNVTLSSIGATPPVIRSTQSAYSVPIYWSGGVNNATWEFYVADPWGTGQSAQDDANFSQVIAVASSPSVLTSPAFDPNPRQSIDISITSVNPGGGPVTPIPMAQAHFHVTGGSIGLADFSVAMGPANHTTQHLALQLGPYPGTQVTFYITAWLPWSESANGTPGAVDQIVSPGYTFNWSTQGGWWYPTYGLLGNLQLTSTPDVTTSAPPLTTTLATGTQVNVSVHSPVENVTIASATIAFKLSDPNGVLSGTIPMSAATANTSYAILPGLPPSATLTFSITAKDVFNNPIASGNYTYSESGPPAVPFAGGYGLFYAEGIDLATGQLIPRINYTIANSTWSEKGVGSSLGFLAPVPIGGVGYLPVAYGSYTVTLSAFGVKQTFTFSVDSAQPFTVVFYFTSKPLTPQTSVDLASTITLPAILGIAGAFVVMFPLTSWFRERRRKAEAEQRRISL